MKYSKLMYRLVTAGVLILGAVAAAAPAVPAHFRADISVGTTGQLFVSWDTMSGAAYYELQRSQSKNSGYSTVDFCSGPGNKQNTDTPSVSQACRDNKLTVGAAYYYEVKACDKNNNCSDFSDPVSNIPVSSNCTNTQMPSMQGLHPLPFIAVDSLAVDKDIKFDSSLQQFAGYPTTGLTRRNLLFVALPGSGEVAGHGNLEKTAENLGFDYISVNYESKAEQRVICGSDLDCYGNISQAKLDATGPCNKPKQPHCGTDPNTGEPYYVSNPSDAVTKRITTMLQYLNSHGYNSNGTDWSSYLSGSEPNWSKIIIGGHSQGGDMGTFAGYKHVIARAVNFSAPPQSGLIGKIQVGANYFSDPKETKIRNFYGLVSINDPLYGMGVYAAVWEVLGFTKANNDEEIKLNVPGSPVGLNCNSGTPSHNFSTSAPISHPGAGHSDPLYLWNEDVWKFMFID